MSLIVMNSKDQNPHHFTNVFSELIQLPRNARVCCQGYSFIRKELSTEDVSGNVMVTSDNNSIAWMFNDPNVADSLVLPLETCKIAPKAYFGDDLALLRNAINSALEESEQVSTYKGGLKKGNRNIPLFLCHLNLLNDIYFTLGFKPKGEYIYCI